MKRFLFLFLFISSAFLRAQYTTTYYFTDDFELTQAGNHHYKAIIESETKYPEGSTKIRVELKNGKLIHKYQYSDLKKGLKMDTTFIFNEDGTIYSITPYNTKGEMVSMLIFYTNGKLWQESYYKNNLIDGVSKTYLEDGNLSSLEYYEKGKLMDTSYKYYESGVIMKKYYYSNGTLKNSFSFNKNGELNFEYGFNSYGDTISIRNHFTGVAIDSLVVEAEPIREQPMYKGGVDALYRYLGNNIKYPSDARDNGIQGKVILKFVVDETGNIYKIQTINPVYPLLDFEAMRVVNKMHTWTPGKQNGQNVKVFYNLPVSFQVN